MLGLTRKGSSTTVSVERNEAGWDHDGIKVEELKRSVLDVEDFPGLSGDGAALVKQGMLATDLRNVLLKCDWDDAKSWTPLAELLETVDTDLSDDVLELRSSFVDSTGELQGDDELRAASEEFVAMRLKLESALHEAMGDYRSTRTGPLLFGTVQRWDRSRLSAAQLQHAMRELTAFPRQSDEGGALMADAQIIVSLRLMLAQCVWGDAISWNDLAEWLLQPAIRERASDGLDEIQAAAAEYSEMRQAVKEGARVQLRLGRSRKLGEGKWSHDELQLGRLRLTLEELHELQALPPPWSRTSAHADDEIKTLEEHVSLALRVRTALAETTDDAASYAALAAVLESVGGELRAFSEFAAALREFDDKREETEAAVRDALARSMSGPRHQGEGVASPKGPRHGIWWSHEKISAATLAAEVQQLTAFPRMSDGGKALEAQARVVVQLRSTLLHCDWFAPMTDVAVCAGWTRLAAAIDELWSEARRGDPLAKVAVALSETQAAGQEVYDKLEWLELTVVAALACCRSINEGTTTGPWSHAGVATAQLAAAVADLEAFPRMRKRGQELIERGHLTVELRRRLLAACDWESAATWGGLADFLDATPETIAHLRGHRLYAEMEARLRSVTERVTNPEAVNELRAGHTELHDMRRRTEENLRAALSAGRSKHEPPCWSHHVLSTSELEAAIPEVLAFARSSAEGRQLVVLGQLVLRIRTALRRSDWSRASSWRALAELLETVDPEMTEAVEVQAAFDELADMRRHTERVVVEEMGKRTSRRLDKYTYSHDEIRTDVLLEARKELLAFPRTSERGRTLAAQAKFTVTIRETILTCDWEVPASWGQLARLLESNEAQFEFAELHELWLANREFEDARLYFEDVARRELKQGRSTRSAGTAIVLFGAHAQPGDHRPTAADLSRPTHATPKQIANERSEPPLTPEQIAKMLVAELRRALAARRLSIDGDIDALRKRLNAHELKREGPPLTPGQVAAMVADELRKVLTARGLSTDGGVDALRKRLSGNERERAAGRNAAADVGAGALVTSDEASRAEAARAAAAKASSARVAAATGAAAASAARPAAVFEETTMTTTTTTTMVKRVKRVATVGGDGAVAEGAPGAEDGGDSDAVANGGGAGGLLPKFEVVERMFGSRETKIEHIDTNGTSKEATKTETFSNMITGFFNAPFGIESAEQRKEAEERAAAERSAEEAAAKKQAGREKLEKRAAAEKRAGEMIAAERATAEKAAAELLRVERVAKEAANAAARKKKGKLSIFGKK